MGDLPNLANRSYVDRLNRAIDHVTRNLNQPLPLEEVAKAACFSPYHFHRIFRAAIGETLHDFVKRVRLERALYLMSHREHPVLTEVALAFGFSSSSDFSRSFREQYGVPPRAFDLERFRRDRRDQMMSALPQGYRLDRLPTKSNPDGFTVRLRDLPPRRVAYCASSSRTRQTAYHWLRLACSRGRENTTSRAASGLGTSGRIRRSSPLDLCRYDVGVEIPDSVTLDGEISETRFPAMRMAEIDIAGPIELEMRALDWLYTTWLPRSGYAPDHQPGFEAWNGLPYAHGDTHFELRVQLAVVDAATQP